MGARNSPTDTTEFGVPYVDLTDVVMNPGDLPDYFGITVNNHATNSIRVNTLPFRAYNMIWNEWFRDQNLDAPITVSTGDGPDGVVYIPNRVRKRHDYFTSALPWPEKPINTAQTGTLDSGGTYNTYNGPYFAAFGGVSGRVGAPVSGLGVAAGASGAGAHAGVKQTGRSSMAWADGHFTTASTPFLMETDLFNNPQVRVLIRDLQMAEAINQLMQRNARGGSRYGEIVRAHFGVISPDQRLQRPEYLGGGRSWITVNPVAQTAPTGIAGTTTVLGELAGVGSGMAQDHGFSSSFVEHGYILGLVCVRANQTYQQGVERMWFRKTTFDFYWPSLAHLGEQAILSREIYADGSAGDLNVFGYQERWAEYKYRASRTSGFFRSTNPTPLDMWHLGQEFGSRPVLNSTFLEEVPPMSRVLQVSTNRGEEFLCDAMFDVRMVRPMPMYSIPGVGTRF